MKQGSFKIFPIDLLKSIFLFLELKELINCTLVCKNFNYLIKNSSLYKLFFSFNKLKNLLEAPGATEELNPELIKKINFDSGFKIKYFPSYFIALNNYFTTSPITNSKIPTVSKKLLSLFSIWSNLVSQNTHYQSIIMKEDKRLLPNDDLTDNFDEIFKAPFSAYLRLSIMRFDIKLHALSFYGKTAFQYYLSNRKHIDLKKLNTILKNGADINSQNQEGDTALHLLIKSPMGKTKRKKILNLAENFSPNRLLCNKEEISIDNLLKKLEF